MHPDARRIELLPNCSLTPRAATVFFMIVAGSSLTIALLFVAGGYWPVLPFAGLELALLAYALATSLRRRHFTQTIEISADEIAITTRGPGGEQHSVFSRHWARVRLLGARGLRPSRLIVQSHGRSCELGGFLNEEERGALGRRLAALIGPRASAPALAPAPLPA
jgi:uncharacterized membrane protein